jgi:tetratricopeptide (TPR) repeat protein
MALKERMLAPPPPDKTEGRFCQLARGTAEYRKGDFAAAAEHLGGVVRDGKEAWWGLRSPAHSVLAMAQQRRGEPDEARATLAQESELWERDAPGSAASAGTHWHDWLMCRVLRREAEEVVLRGNAAASDVPGDWPPLPDDDGPSWAARGREHLRAGRPGAAAEAFVRAVARRPDDMWLSYQTAALLASVDPAAYDRHRRELLGRWGDAADPQTAERVSKACLLRPAAGADLDRAVRLAERAEVSLPDDEWLAPFVELARALAEYRRGAFAAAEQRLDGLLAAGKATWNVNAPGWSVLALARHRLGRPGAREALDRATGLLGGGPVRVNRGAGDGGQDRLIAEVLHREAEEAILGKAVGKN